MSESDTEPRVVIVGGGFGGLLVARGLGRAAASVTLIDRRNHHLFQPLLYQVATGGLSPANIAAPLRALVKDQSNTRVLLAEVAGFDLDRQCVLLGDGGEVPYDQLVVATGAGQSYFGHDEWSAQAPGLKTLEDATRIRRRILLAFERAEREQDPERRRALMTFVVVGAGPTGVELAGAIAEVAFGTLAGELRNADTREARVILVEGANRVLQAFPETLSAAAETSLAQLGVTVRTQTMVDDMTPGRIELRNEQDARETIAAETVLWAAGVQASPLGAQLAAQSDAEVDRIGRVVVAPDCRLAGRPEVFVIGDLALFQHGTERPLPGLAPVAMQQGRYVARHIRRQIEGRGASKPFHYRDKGSMATIGRKMAVAQMGKLRWSGLFAWLAWLFIHLLYITQFQHRILVIVQWGWNYITRNRSARLITRVVDEPPLVEEAKDGGSTGGRGETRD